MSFDYEANKHLVTDSTGKKLTSGLFEELADPGSAARPIFKLSEWRKTYVDIADPTGYKAAMELLGSWEHWEALLKCKPFTDALAEWNKEVETKLQSNAISNLIKQSKTDKGTAAAKWLAEKGFVEKKRGRPKNEMPDKLPDNVSQIRQDAKRLGL